MTLQETKDIILKWIASCETSEQTSLLEDAIKNFWIKPFEIESTKKKVSITLIEVQSTRYDLIQAIETKKITLAVSGRQSDTGVPTLDRYNPEL